jgi:hypothetical protein
MRFGRPLLLALVLLHLAIPASAAAERAKLSAADAKQTVTVQLEHAALSGAPEKRSARPVGRPRVVEIAKRFLGTPYRWAGASPAGFDCSGFVMYVYSRVGIQLPHSSWVLWGVGKPVARKDLRHRLLQRPRSRGHLCRPRALHPLAPDGRRRANPARLRSRVIRRRAPVVRKRVRPPLREEWGVRLLTSPREKPTPCAPA